MNVLLWKKSTAWRAAGYRLLSTIELVSADQWLVSTCSGKSEVALHLV
jgi:hypothetical protein